MDTRGKADPYCVIKFGNEEHYTTIQYDTLDPVWNQTFVFEVDNIPQTAFAFPVSATTSNGVPQISQVPLCELLYYIYIDVWDKDTMNRLVFLKNVLFSIFFILWQ